MSDSEMVYGTFKYEIKNRFLCLVSVAGEDIVCYIPSSCRLSNFIDLNGKTVMLRPVKAKNVRTNYAVYAVKYGGRFILLNLSQPNRVIEMQLHRRYFSFLGSRKNVKREQRLGEYKSDLYIFDTNTIIEIKSLLAFQKQAVFPTIYSERAIKQLKILSDLLDKGYRVCYMLVSLNTQVKTVAINPKVPEFYRAFQECIGKGMQCCGYAIRLNGETPEISSRVEFDNTF